MAGQSMIQGVEFTLSGDDEHRSQSATIISKPTLFEGMMPTQEGVYDLKLGTTDYELICGTCKHGKKQCMGHRGHIELKTAVPQPIAISEIRKWLRIICFKCFEPIVPKEKILQLNILSRFKDLTTSSANDKRKCANCAHNNPKVIKADEDHFTFYTDSEQKDGSSKRKLLSYDMIKFIFDHITTETIQLLGKSRCVEPKKLVLTVIVVPPNTIRPGVKSFGGASSSYHDSTNMLQHIVNRNSALGNLPFIASTEDIESVDKHRSEDLEKSILNLGQLIFDMILGSSSTNATQGNKGKRGLVVGTRPVNSFLRNLPRKDGRLRLNLLGKRSFYMARSTISGNSRFKIDEVGIPLEYARTLQVKEIVQEFNKDWLMPFFLNGRKQYPGCTYIVRKSTGKKHDVSGLKDIRLEIGDVIYRDVIKGDRAFFNRAPTLERSSIGVHKVIVMQDPNIYTFQMNVSACENYNADFDGDAMTLWVAREPASRAEASIMSSIDNWFISTKNSGPVNGEVQDSTVGGYELTRSDVFINKYHAMGLFSAAGIEMPRFDKYPHDKIYTGREIVSMILEKVPINYEKTPSSYKEIFARHIPYDADETKTVIKHGIMLKGVLDKSSIGAKSTGSVFHLIAREHGKQKALLYVYAFQQVILQFLAQKGFTIGTADILPSPEMIKELNKLTAKLLLESQNITDNLIRRGIIAPMGSTINEHYEKLQIAALNVPDAEALRWILKDIDPNSNGLFKMIATGSKGNIANMLHIMGIIGQTTINGDRIKEQFAFRRTSPYFPRFATDPEAYGFVKNNYISGMNSSEFIFQDMNGRFDLINKALSTARTGYFMRKGAVNNQSSIVDNFRRVSKDTKVVQMIYGEDGLDSRELEMVRNKYLLVSNSELKTLCWLESKTIQSEIDAAFQKIVIERDEQRLAHIKLEASMLGKKSTYSGTILSPVAMRQIIEKITTIHSSPSKIPDDVLLQSIQKVDTYCEEFPYLLINDIQRRQKTPIPIHKKMATKFISSYIRAELSPKRLSTLSAEQVDSILELASFKYTSALIDYGTTVGLLAVQSVSEPITQYMLDSHHRSVAGGTSKSGIQRVEEIYGACAVEKEKSPAMQLNLKNQKEAEDVARIVEYSEFRRFVASYDLLLEPFAGIIYPGYISDKLWLTEFCESHPLIKIPSDLTNWCTRFVLNKSMMLLKSITLELIIKRLRIQHPGAFVTHTSESVQTIVVRIWHKISQFKKSTKGEEQKARELIDDLLETPIRGINGITRASVEEITKTTVGEDGALVEEKRSVITTFGTNLYEAFMRDEIDSTRTISNSIGDTYKLLGIEAARMKVITETMAFMGDAAPNPRHLFVWADEMSSPGFISSVEQGSFGQRESNNIFLCMAYGSPIQVLAKAAINQSKSKIYGIAANEILGAIPQIGTLYNTCIVDEDFLQKHADKSLNDLLDSI